MEESGGDSSFVEYSNDGPKVVKDRTTSQLTKNDNKSEAFEDYSKDEIQKSKSQANTSMMQVAEMEESDFSDKKQLPLTNNKSVNSVKPKS